MIHRQWHSRHLQGFTLLELLVVISMLAVIAAVVSPSILRTPGTELQISAGQLASALKKARLQAQKQRVSMPLKIDVETGAYGYPDLESPEQLDSEISIRLTTAEREIENHGVGAIRFFPDGSSSGGRITLGLGTRTLHVDVEWLTGRIRLLDPENT